MAAKIATIRELNIVGFRGFATKQTLQFAVPSGKRGSGLTVVVGANNAGKSSVIETLRSFVLDQPSFTQGKRNKLAGDRVELVLVDGEGKSHRIENVQAGGSETTTEGQRMAGELLVVPPRRHFAPNFSRGSRPRNAYAVQLGASPTRNTAADVFTQRLFDIAKNRGQFDSVLGRILRPMPRWYLDQGDNGEHFLAIDFGAGLHNSDGAGDGLLSLMFLVDALYDSSVGDAIVVDEPELSLHPSVQRRLVEVLLDYTKDRQIVVATHSPYFVSPESLQNDAEIARVYRDNRGSMIARLSPDVRRELGRLANDRNNPHVFGLDAREVFFMDDGIILTEGQEDVVHYRRIADELGMSFIGEFFGWGVGGADRMRLIARLLRDLGFKRVAGILDGNKQGVAEALRSEFPDFVFFVIPEMDVRSKREVGAKASVKGLLDLDGRLVPEHRESARRLIGEVNQVLSGTFPRTGEGGLPHDVKAPVD